MIYADEVMILEGDRDAQAAADKAAIGNVV